MKNTSFVICLCMLAALARSEESEQLPKLQIQRNQRAVHLNSRSDPYPRRWINRGKGLFEVKFRLPAILHQFSDGEEDVKREDIKDVLVRSGIVFGPGSAATLNDKSDELTVILPSEEMEKVEMLLGVGGCIIGLVDRSIAVRVEIYELPLVRMRELQESAASEGEHSAERNAALEYVSKYKGRCVATPTVLCKSSSRGVVKDVIEFPVAVETNATQKTGDNMTWVMDKREVGTVLEVTATPDMDSETITLDLELQHDTAPPTMVPVTNRLNLPAFHRKSVSSQLQLESGQYLLFASWRSSETLEDASKEMGQVLFVTANLVVAGDYGQKMRNDGNQIEKNANKSEMATPTKPSD